MFNVLVKVPVDEVEKLYPFNGPTTRSELVKLVPLITNELGPATVPKHMFPKEVSAVALNVGTIGTTPQIETGDALFLGAGALK
jgi:hypothetical protein